MTDLQLDHIEHADALTYLRSLPDDSVNLCVSSPPYFGLRDYGVDGQIGLEPTPTEYVAALVDIFREVRRVLRADGNCYVNLGDSYVGYKGEKYNQSGQRGTGELSSVPASHEMGTPHTTGLPPKSLMLIPHRFAIAMQDAGWLLREDIVWCLSGGAWVYARTQKGDMPMMVRDMYRLDPKTVKLWNGQKWTQVLGMSRTPRAGEELELVLRSGERISCTPNHEWPTKRGLLRADQLRLGDVLETCTLPEPDVSLRPPHIGTDAAWFVGLYIAEGSRSNNALQIAGHTKEEARWERVQAIAKSYGGSASRTIDGNKMSIRVFGKMLHTLVDMFVSGRVASDKALNPIVWRYSNEWLRALLDGYLSGDGHYDAKNDRWRIGFTRNYGLERDLRILAARLGLTLTLKMSHATMGGRLFPTFRGELRFGRNGHRNERPRSEVVEIRMARCREVYEIGVEDEPHVYALASGVLTHNCKPNPMPESVQDRCTRAHEYIFHFTKGPKYWYDQQAVMEDAVGTGGGTFPSWLDDIQPKHGGESQYRKDGQSDETKRNRRSVWTVNTAGFAEAHFATFPEKLVEPMVLAGCPEWVCERCGAPYEAQVEKESNWEARKANGATGGAKTNGHNGTHGRGMSHDLGGGAVTHYGYAPSCTCNAGKRAGVVLDPFAGAGTTALVAKRLNRRYIGCDLNAEYVEMARRRVESIPYTLFSLMGAD